VQPPPPPYIGVYSIDEQLSNKYTCTLHKTVDVLAVALACAHATVLQVLEESRSCDEVQAARARVFCGHMDFRPQVLPDLVAIGERAVAGTAVVVFVP
jgi:hypothetical protein